MTGFKTHGSHNFMTVLYVGIKDLLLALMAIRVLEACLMMIHKPAMCIQCWFQWKDKFEGDGQCT